MASWVPQTYHLPGPIDILLGVDEIVIDSTWGERPTILNPANREEANQMAIALRHASKRLEEIGMVRDRPWPKFSFDLNEYIPRT